MKFPNHFFRRSDGNKRTFYCRLSKSNLDWGQCRLRTEVKKSSEKDSVSIQVQMYKSEDCECDNYEAKRRGLPKQMVSQISTLIGTEPNVQPGQTKMNIMHQQMNTSIDDELQLTMNSSEERKSVGAQIANCFNHNKNKAKKNGTIADACALVGDVVKLKEEHLFTPPDQPSTDLKKRI